MVPRNRPALWVCSALFFAMKGGDWAMQWLRHVFSGAADASRVNPLGVLLMLAAVAIVCLAGKIAHRLWPEAQEGAKNAVKLIGLVICAGGAMLAILG